MTTPLEEAARAAAAEMGILPTIIMTDEQAAEFRERFAAEMAKMPQQHRIIDRPPLTEDEIRSLLRECVTVVKPGETLIFTPSDSNWTPNQLRELQDSANRTAEFMGLEFRILVVPPGSLGIAEAAAGA